MQTISLYTYTDHVFFSISVKLKRLLTVFRFAVEIFIILSFFIVNTFQDRAIFVWNIIHKNPWENSIKLKNIMEMDKVWEVDESYLAMAHHNKKILLRVPFSFHFIYQTSRLL